MDLFVLAPLVIGLPVFGLLINMLFGRQQGERFAGIIASSAVGLAFLVAVSQFIALQGQPEGHTVELIEWIAIGELDISWALKVDSLSVTMMLMVTGVSTLIHVYAIGYMHEDVRFQGDPGRYTRFFVYFNLFVAAMMVLVTGDSLLTMFVGWEGVGLCSYLLIGFWFEKGEGGIGNALAGKKAFVVNRVGDLGFLIAMFIAFWAFGTLRFEEIFEQAELVSTATITAITLFLLVGATGKSAQLPLFVWLPDAMAGPTPVSALIHAATMVTAGIYMIARNAVLFELAPIASGAVAAVGAATALFAATIAVGQFDIKRVLAYSTISQLGFMIAAVGIGAYAAGMFHLLAHAFFKALLFLSAGSVIQGVEHGHHHAEAHGDEAFDPNDMRVMGGLRQRMPVTFWVYLIGALALAGIPPLAGFFSKDEILADAAAANPAIYWTLTAAALLTAFYMGRQLFMVFGGHARSEAAKAARENPPVMVVPLIGLAALAVLGGAINLPGLHPLTSFLEHTLEHLHATEFNPLVAGISSGLAGAGLLAAWLAYGRPTLRKGFVNDPLRARLGPIWTGIEHKWWVDELYDVLVAQPYVRLAGFLADTLDGRFWHDWFHDQVLARSFRNATGWLNYGFDLPVIDGAANRLADLTRGVANWLRGVQTGYVRNYAISVFIGLVLMLSYLLIR